MPRLDDRLRCVAEMISGNRHADIGSDHGHLLAWLIQNEKIDFGIAIENKSVPMANSQRTLARYPVEVRFANGLDGIRQGEVDSLSICGMGADTIVRILDQATIVDRAPVLDQAPVLNRLLGRVPDQVVIQPNDHPERIRQWALESGFHLVRERTVGKRRLFDVLKFIRPVDPSSHSRFDPAYQGLDQDLAILFGPHHLRERSSGFLERMKSEQDYLAGLPRTEGPAKHRLDAIRRVLNP